MERGRWPFGGIRRKEREGRKEGRENGKGKLGSGGRVESGQAGGQGIDSGRGDSSWKGVPSRGKKGETLKAMRIVRSTGEKGPFSVAKA